MLRKFLASIFSVFLFLLPLLNAHAMSSLNYQLNQDSVNSGGDDVSQSLNYIMQDTKGEQAIGSGGSASYIVSAGYRSFFTTSSALTITSVQSSGVDKTTAVITWTTNIASDSTVEYGLSQAYGASAADATQTLSHSVTLTGLTPGTLYHFRAVSDNGSGLTGTSGDYTFTTLPNGNPPPPPPPPLQLNLTNIQAVQIDKTVATITWTSDLAANSQVDYGLTSNYGASASTPGFVKDHSLQLTGLSAGTLYHFRVTSVDGNGNAGVSVDYTFTTVQDVQPLTITNVAVSTIKDTSAVITWTTSAAADSKVEYWTNGVFLTMVDLVPVISHSMTLTGLLPSTAYTFDVVSVDSSFQTAKSDSVTFATANDVTPPANISNFSASSGDALVQLSWTNPSDVDFSGIRIVRSIGAPPLGPNDGELVYVGSAIAANDGGVKNDIVYFYGAYAFDLSGNFASGAFTQGSPKGGVNPPQIPPPQIPPLPPPQIPPVPPEIPPQIPQQPPSLPPQLPGQPSLPQPVEPSIENPLDIPSEPQPLPNGQQVTIHPRFYTAGGTVELVPDQVGSFGALGGTAVTVSVPASDFPTQVERGFVVVAGSTYGLVPTIDGMEYTSSFVVPQDIPYAAILVSVSFIDGGIAAQNFTVAVQSAGMVVLEGVRGQSADPVDRARVTLYDDSRGGVAWNSAPYTQMNPYVTRADGTFSFVVPNGTYHLVVEKDGYVTVQTPPKTISRNVFAERVGLVKKPTSIVEAIASTSTGITKVVEIAKSVSQNITYGATVAREVIQSPVVQETVQTSVAPSLVTIAVVNTASSLSVFNALTYLQYLFTQPLLLLGRRKRKKWGAVYNSLTKNPVELAIVRLIRVDTGVVVQSRVTDVHGRYSFLPPPGLYKIEVTKPGYVYPTAYLQGKTQDADYLDLYQGNALTVEAGGVVAANVPLDPIVAVEPSRTVLWRHALQRVKNGVSLVTLIGSIVAVVISPTVVMGLLTLAQVAAYLVFKRFSYVAKAKEWGIVFDPETRKPLQQVIVRIFDAKFNKLLETQVTDANGRYGFFVRKSVYYITAEKEGFEKYTSPQVDLTTTEEAVVDQNISLQRKK